jgi:hypothetical protein
VVVCVCCIVLHDARTKATSSAYNEYGRHLGDGDKEMNAARLSIRVCEVKMRDSG